MFMVCANEKKIDLTYVIDENVPVVIIMDE